MSLYQQVREVLRKNRDKPLMDVLKDWEPEENEAIQKLNEESKNEKSNKYADGGSCLITGCNHEMQPADVMAHYVIAHKELRIERVFDDSSPAMAVDIDFNNMKKDHVYCLKLLSFGGKIIMRKKNLPVIGCRKLENNGLPTALKHLAYDLPILIMGTRTIVGLPLKPEHKGLRHGQNMLVVWPVTIETATTARDIFCRIFTMKPSFLLNKRTVVEMRSFRDSEWAGRLLIHDPGTFSLLESDMNNLNVRIERLVVGFKFKYSIFSSSSVEAAASTVPERVSDDESGKTFTID